MPSNVTPMPLVMRYEPGQTLSQDILGEIEAFACASRSQRTAGWTYDGPEWFKLEYSERLFKTPHQLNALEQGQTLNFPYAHPERVREYDVTRRRDLRLISPPQPAVGAIVETTIELVRVHMERWGVSVLERIGTHVQGVPIVVDGEGVVAVNSERVNFGGDLNGGPLVAGLDHSQAQIPCPFPQLYPGGNPPASVDPAPGPTLEIRFHLIRQLTSRRDGIEPPFFAGAVDDLPAGERPIAPWEDMRYYFHALGATNHKWVMGGFGILRLFAHVRLVSTAADPGRTGYDFVFCSRLTGYCQEAGPAGAARRGALWRV